MYINRQLFVVEWFDKEEILCESLRSLRVAWRVSSMSIWTLRSCSFIWRTFTAFNRKCRAAARHSCNLWKVVRWMFKYEHAFDYLTCYGSKLRSHNHKLTIRIMIFLMLMDCAVGCCCCSSRSEFFASGPTSLVVAPIAGPFIIGQQSIHACFEPFQQPTSDRWNTFSYYQKIKVKYVKALNFLWIQRRCQFTGPNFFSLHNRDMIINWYVDFWQIFASIYNFSDSENY